MDDELKKFVDTSLKSEIQDAITLRDRQAQQWQMPTAPQQVSHPAQPKAAKRNPDEDMIEVADPPGTNLSELLHGPSEPHSLQGGPELGSAPQGPAGGILEATPEPTTGVDPVRQYPQRPASQPDTQSRVEKPSVESVPAIAGYPQNTSSESAATPPVQLPPSPEEAHVEIWEPPPSPVSQQQPAAAPQSVGFAGAQYASGRAPLAGAGTPTEMPDGLIHEEMSPLNPMQIEDQVAWSFEGMQNQLIDRILKEAVPMVMDSASMGVSDVQDQINEALQLMDGRNVL